MSTNTDNIAGIIRNIFDPGIMEEWQKYFQKWTMTGDHILNCYGIDEKNVEAEKWFQENIFSKITETLGNHEMRSIFGMYAESVDPYPIHTDDYHVEKNKKNGKPYISWLIPYKVDGSHNELHRASTIIFNESGDEMSLNIVKNSIDDELRRKYFSHCNIDVLKKCSIYKIIHWEPGSLIYWNEKNLHCSGSFNGFTTKEMFVGHTFIPDY
jgi:hypothetical protein